MELLRPHQIKHKNGITVMAIVKSSFEYTEPVTNVKVHKSIKTLDYGQMGYPGDNINFIKADEEKARLYGGMQSLIKNCVDNAEDIKSTIHQILQQRSTNLPETERVEMMKMDFMDLRKWFLEEIDKSKEYRQFTEFNSPTRWKQFRRMLFDFITDRNIYTHGELCFVGSQFDFAIEYIDPDTKHTVYANITKEVLISYNQCYKAIKTLISEYSIIKQNEQTTYNDK